MFKLILNVFVMFTLNSNLKNAISSAQETRFSARQMGQSIAQCFGASELINCFEDKIFAALDQTIANNETWRISDFLVVEKNANNNDQIDLQDITSQYTQQVPLNDRFALKLLQLAQKRSLRIQLPSASVNKLFNKRSTYSALDDSRPSDNNMAAEDVGANGQELEQEEGRKKRHKDKNMAMMGGMAMLAMVAQMFLGKVILIAGAAFVMAKVALLISALGSLKKETSGSPAGTEHVIVTSGGGVSSAHSHEHVSSWHRRAPFEHNMYEAAVPIAEQKFSEPIKYFEVADKNYLKKRHPYKNNPSKNVLLDKINSQ